MTEDEMLAEEWLDERYLKDMGVRKPCKEAFLAGLKAGREIEKQRRMTNKELSFIDHKYEEIGEPVYEENSN